MPEWLKCAAEAAGTSGTLFILFHLFTHELPVVCLSIFGAYKLYTRGDTCTKEHKCRGIDSDLNRWSTSRNRSPYTE